MRHITEDYCKNTETVKSNVSKSSTKKHLIYSVLIIVALLAVGLAAILLHPVELTVEFYSINADISQAVRIVHLTDLHSCEYGEQNKELLALVKNMDPDLILMTGDMIDESSESPSVIIDLISALSAEAPLYYGYGNHETEWQNRHTEDLAEILSEAGAIVVNGEYIDTEINGQPIRIGGYSGYYRNPGMLYKSDEQMQSDIAFADDFENTDRFKILLCHIPTVWLNWNKIDVYPVDLVLSGHYHGGQIRLPIIGGLYAPYVGLFPKYTKGVFEGKAAACVLSAGLANSCIRLNNPPEIISIDLIPAMP